MASLNVIMAQRAMRECQRPDPCPCQLYCNQAASLQFDLKMGKLLKLTSRGCVTLFESYSNVCIV